MVRSFMFRSHSIRSRTPKGYNAGYSFAYSALALFRIGTSESASFQSVRKTS